MKERISEFLQGHSGCVDDWLCWQRTLRKYPPWLLLLFTEKVLVWSWFWLVPSSNEPLSLLRTHIFIHLHRNPDCLPHKGVSCCFFGALLICFYLSEERERERDDKVAWRNGICLFLYFLICLLWVLSFLYFLICLFFGLRSRKKAVNLKKWTVRTKTIKNTTVGRIPEESIPESKKEWFWLYMHLLCTFK